MTREKDAFPKPKLLPRSIIWLACLLVCVAIPLYALKVAHKQDYTDFEVYYRAAKRVQAGFWDQVYNLSDGASPFRYAPPLLPFFRPFAWLPIEQARMAWYFLQVGWFAAGFYCLYRALGLTRAGHGRASGPQKGAPALPRLSLAITAAALLFILRFCLDCFTIGQVSSLLFVGYAAALWAWMASRPGLAGSALLAPSVFKIGPGFLFSLFAIAPKRRERERAIAIPLLWIALATFFLRVWCGSFDVFRSLWSGWLEIVANDSVYYDASHYGSQSIKSAILRAANSGWLTSGEAQALYLSVTILGCAAILGFWLIRRPRGPLGRGAFFALGVFPYLWFMPETFKYSLTTLAIPVALLLAEQSDPRRRASRLTWIALAFGALTLSAAGLDIVGARLFFGLQRASVPLMATLLLGLATLRQALRHSAQAPLLANRSTRELAPWAASPRTEPSLELSMLVPVPMQSVGTPPPSWLAELVHKQRAALERICPGRFEILLIPYGNRADRQHPVWGMADRLARQGSSARLLRIGDGEDRGAALRDGFLESRGRLLLALNVEQPAEPPFYAEAVSRMTDASGPEVVRGNRRLAESRFRIPVRTLPLVYGRHRLGLIFNRLVRALLPCVRATDTHSGSWVISRRAAIAIFALQKSAGFLFDLEAWITATTHGFRQLDLPVTLDLPREKSAKRVGRETLAILRGLPALWRRYRSGYYAPWGDKDAPGAITADDWGITPGVNRGILELARLGIVRRVSLMAHGAHLKAHLDELRSIPGLSLGLHFDLTLGKGTPGSVLKQWLLARGVKRAELAERARAELKLQLDVLRQAGVTPRHLDGHHHIHLVPGLLDALAPVIREAGIEVVRLPQDPALLWRKPALWLLTQLARPGFARNGFATLPCYYPQAAHFNDQGRLRAELRREPRAEVIVHPAETDDLPLYRIPDPYTSGRVTEYQALKMLAFDCPSEGRLS
jgi:predicted glycoside hydrolase/deacetylase ChbG (UPF0249 family)